MNLIGISPRPVT